MSEMMRAAVWHGEPELRVQLWHKPVIGPDQVLVQVAYPGICASDLHIINNGLPRTALSLAALIDALQKCCYTAIKSIA